MQVKSSLDKTAAAAKTKSWNTHNLGLRLAADAAAAATAGVLVAPLITMIDKYVYILVFFILLFSFLPIILAGSTQINTAK